MDNFYLLSVVLKRKHSMLSKQKIILQNYERYPGFVALKNHTLIVFVNVSNKQILGHHTSVRRISLINNHNMAVEFNRTECNKKVIYGVLIWIMNKKLLLFEKKIVSRRINSLINPSAGASRVYQSIFYHRDNLFSNRNNFLFIIP